MPASLAADGRPHGQLRASDTDAAGGASVPGGRLLMLLCFAYIGTLGFEAALRWIFSKFGADAAIYLKDMLLLSAGLLALRHAVQRGADSRPVAVMAWVLLWLCLVGLASDMPIGQVLFGLKVWLPFAVGFVLVDSGVLARVDRPRLWGLLWAVLCAGILLNYFYRTPWAGMTAQIGDSSVEVNRDWTTYGIRRVSGFSRSSYDGAIIILLLEVYLVSTLRSFWLRAGLMLVSLIAITMTTSKGAVGALICTFLFVPLAAFGPELRRALRLPSLLVLATFALIGLLAPLLSTQFSVPIFPNPTSVDAKLFASLADRGWATWPGAFELLSDWQWVFGRGLGGIGAAQFQFEPAFASPADNMFVYLFVTGGVIGALLYVVPVALAFRLGLDTRRQRYVLMMLVAIYSYGMTASIIDNAPLALAVGALLASLFRDSQDSQDAEEHAASTETAVAAKPLPS